MKKRRRRRKRRTCKTGTVLQTVLLDRSSYNKHTAKLWLKSHGFKVGLDVKPNTLRARQESPRKFVSKSFRTITLKKGIKAVVGCPK